jgi:hypothetical protein
MVYDIVTYQGDDLPLYTLELTDSTGLASWLNPTDTVVASYHHCDDTVKTATLVVLTYGDDDTPAQVQFQPPCVALNAAAPWEVVPGEGRIIFTRVTSGGSRETATEPVTYIVYESP